MTTKSKPTIEATVTKPKAKRARLTIDQDLLKKLVSLLEKEKMTKEQLAEKLELGNAKKISDSVLLSAVKYAGNSAFLANIIEKAGGRAKKGPYYSAKKGLVVPAWLFEGKEVIEGQKYSMTFGSRKGVITLKPTFTEDVDGGDE